MPARHDSKTPRPTAHAPVEIMVWDLPTRTFHWALALAFGVGAATSEDQWLKLHAIAGYAIMGLLVFRLFWGFVGGHYSRFAQFRYSWKEVKSYLLELLAGHHRQYLSHNPAGSWSVMILLVGCAIVVFGGLLLLGGEEQHGVAEEIDPLFGDIARWVHLIVGNLIIGFVLVHIAGVVVDSKLSGVNLLRSMLSGCKTAPAGSVSVKPGGIATVVMVLFVVAVTAGLTYVEENASINPLTPFQSEPLPQSSLWQDNCGECHMAWHPSLLPARSWKKLLAEQHQHFGEDLFLEQQDIDNLLAFALANSADHGVTEPARKINASIDSGVSPLRITDTPYWQDKHDEIAKDVWQRESVAEKSNCVACHADATQGYFDDNAMRVPD